MQRTFRVKGFSKFQHYGDKRNPPWIKLYNNVLEDYEIAKLDDVKKAHLFAIWLLASRYQDDIPLDNKFIQNKINANHPVDLDFFVKSGFILINQSCSKMLADGYQDAMLEESRVDKSREKEKNKKEKRPKKIPDNFELEQASIDAGLKIGFNEKEIKSLFDDFVNHAHQKNRKQLNWRLAFIQWMNTSYSLEKVQAMRKLNGNTKNDRTSSTNWYTAFKELEAEDRGEV
jgi:hypothetical protein